MMKTRNMIEGRLREAGLTSRDASYLAAQIAQLVAADDALEATPEERKTTARAIKGMISALGGDVVADVLGMVG